MLTIPRLAAPIAALALLCAAPVQAQATFDRLPERVRPGQTVIVVDDIGANTKGEVVDVSASTLVVRYARGRIEDPSLATTRTFSPDKVRRVLKPGPIWDGAVKGAAVGLVPALLLLGAECYGCGLGGAAAFSVAAGAGIGIGIDALWGPKTVFRGSAGIPRLSVAPIAGNGGRRGVAATVRF